MATYIKTEKPVFVQLTDRQARIQEIELEIKKLQAELDDLYEAEDLDD